MYHLIDAVLEACSLFKIRRGRQGIGQGEEYVRCYSTWRTRLHLVSTPVATSLIGSFAYFAFLSR